MNLKEIKELVKEYQPLKFSRSAAEFGPTHSIFLIQNILEEILNFFEFKALWKSRLVCHFWNRTAAPILQKKRTLYFRGYSTFPGVQASRKFLALRPLLNRSEYYVSLRTFKSKKFSDLIQLLENSKVLNLAAYFPYRRFQFSDCTFGSFMGNLNDEPLQRFFDIFGMHIEELSICFDSNDGTLPNSDFPPSHKLHERGLMKLMENLLVNQAPSLTFLSLEIRTRVSWEVDAETRGKMSSLRVTDPEFQNIQQNLEGKTRNSKLRFLHWTNQVSAKALEVILQLAPRLQTIVLQTGYEHLLTEPVQRLHLLRSVDINPRYGSIQSLETLSSACRTVNLLRLQNIFIRFCHCTECVEKGHWTEELQLRLIDVINAIFYATDSSSLKSVDWFGACEPQVLTQIQFSNVKPSIFKFGREDDPLYPRDVNKQWARN